MPRYVENPPRCLRPMVEGLKSAGIDVRAGLGEVRNHRFVSSKRPLDRSMHQISHQYVDHYDDPKRWMFSAWMRLTSKGQQLALSLEQRAVDSYRDSWAGADRCENVVTHDFSTHDIEGLTQLRAQVAGWQTAATRLNRDVA
jgi:hypothetical protein